MIAKGSEEGGDGREVDVAMNGNKGIDLPSRQVHTLALGGLRLVIAEIQRERKF